MSAVRSHLVTVLILAAASAGCLLPAEPSDPLTVTLAPGQSASYRALTVEFVGVTSDSRCPGDAMCIQQGDAVFTIEARVRTSAATSYELQINDPQRRSVTHAGYSIEAQTLDPYPFTINPIEPEEYRLTVTLDRE